MEVKYKIHTGNFIIQVFTDESSKRCKGSVLVQDVNSNLDSVFIQPFNTVGEFKNAIIDLYEYIEVTDDTAVEITIGKESWLALMPYTFNWHNAVRIGYTSNEQEDPMSFKNQNIIPIDKNSLKD